MTSANDSSPFPTHAEVLKTNKERRAAYYAKHREAILAKLADYRARNAAIIRSRKRDYYRRNREKISQKNAEVYINAREERLKKATTYAKENREKIQAYKAAYNRKNREINRAKAKKRREQNREKYAIYYAARRSRALAKKKEWRAKHQERIKKYSQSYRQAHKELYRQVNECRRARRIGATISDLTMEQWRSIKEHYVHHCVYCGVRSQRLTQDHITPLSQGGSHTVRNVVPACRSCNSRKGTGPVLKAIQPLLLAVGS